MSCSLPASASVVDRPHFKVLGLVIVWSGDGSGGGVADPFTGSGAYSSSGGDSVPMQTEVSHFPQNEFLTFAQKPNVAAMTKKLKEFNGQVEQEDSKLNDADIEKLTNLCNSGKT